MRAERRYAIVEGRLRRNRKRAMAIAQDAQQRRAGARTANDKMGCLPVTTAILFVARSASCRLIPDQACEAFRELPELPRQRQVRCAFPGGRLIG